MPRRRILLWALLVPLAYAPTFIVGGAPGGPAIGMLAASTVIALGAALSLGRSPALERLTARLEPLAGWMLFAAVVVFVALSTLVAYGRFTHYRESAMLGLFSQCYWTHLHGFTFANSQEAVDGTLASHFGLHFSPTLLVLLPLFALWPSPMLLMIAQVAAIGLAPVPLFAMLRHRVGSGAALLFALALLLLPVFAWSGYADFRDSSFLPVLLLAMAWAMEARQWIWLGLFGLAALGLREDVGLAFVALGAFAFVSRQGTRLALILAGVGAAWFVLIPGLVMRHFWSPGLIMDPPRFFAAMFGHWGATPARAVIGILTHPAEVVSVVTSREVARYVYSLLLPLLLLPPFGDWAVLVALPGLAVNLLASYSFMRSSLEPYALAPLAFLALATARTGARLAQGAPETQRASAGLALGVIVLAGVLPATGLTVPGPERPAPPARTVEALMRIVPPNAPVYAPVVLYPYLSDRATFDTWSNVGRLALRSSFRSRYELIVLWPASDPHGERRDAALADSLVRDSLFIERRGFAPFVVYRRR